MLTAKQYAEQSGAPYSTVMSWLQRDLIPGVKREDLPIGGWFYLIPADAPRPETRRGPKKKTDSDNGAEKPVKKARRKEGDDQ